MHVYILSIERHLLVQQFINRVEACINLNTFECFLNEHAAADTHGMPTFERKDAYIMRLRAEELVT